MTFFAAGLSLSICLFFLGTKPSPVMSAGAISSAHSGHDVTCDRCHAASSESWAASAFDVDVAMKGSGLCVDCHGDLGPQPRSIHGLPAEQLAQLTAKPRTLSNASQPVLLAFASQLVNPDAEQALDCNACHFEHRGFDNDLKAIADDRCQTCHKNQFVSFEHGHPEFDSYPYSQPAHIAFDHATHFNRYFKDDAKRLMPDATSPQECRACHVVADDGGAMLTRGYEQMCAACHEREIEDREFPGVPLIALSQLDPAGNRIEWPTLSADPPMLKSPGLLSLLLDEESTTVTAVDDAGDYVAQVKSLFEAVSVNGEAALTGRLAPEWQPLVTKAAGLVPAILSAQRHWFPAANDSDDSTPRPLSTDPPDDVIGGGVYVRNADLSLRYHPTGHADPYVKQWLDVAIDVANRRPGQKSAIDEMLTVFSEPNAAGGPSTRGPVSSGRCLSCHTTSSTSKGKQFIQWDARSPQQSMRLLTRFAHRPHVLENQVTSCRECHQLNDIRVKTTVAHSKTSSEHAADIMLGTFQPRQDFQPLSKANCTACHNQSLKSNACTTCHDYHATPTALGESGHLGEFLQSAVHEIEPE